MVTNPIIVFSRASLVDKKNQSETRNTNELQSIKELPRLEVSLDKISILTLFFSLLTLCLVNKRNFIKQSSRPENLTNINLPDAISLESLINYLPSFQTTTFYFCIFSISFVIVCVYSRFRIIVAFLPNLYNSVCNLYNNVSNQAYKIYTNPNYPVQDAFSVIKTGEQTDRFLICMGLLQKLGSDCGCYLTNTNNGSFSISPINSVIFNHQQYKYILHKVLASCEKMTVAPPKFSYIFPFSGVEANEVINKHKLSSLEKDFNSRVDEVYSNVTTPLLLSSSRNLLDSSMMKFALPMLLERPLYSFLKILKNKAYDLLGKTIRRYFITDAALGNASVQAIKKRILSLTYNIIKPHVESILKFLPDTYLDMILCLFSWVIALAVCPYIKGKIKAYILIEIYKHQHKKRMSSTEGLIGFEMLQSAKEEALKKRSLP